MSVQHGLRYQFTAFACVAALGVFGTVANAQAVEDILGKWNMVTEFGGNANESMVEFSVVDGALKAVASSQRGSRELIDPKYENGVLSWGLIIPRLGNEPIRVEVKVEGDKFSGGFQTPIGEVPIRGEKHSPELEAKRAEATKALLGEWDVYTTFNGQPGESQLRVYLDEENDLRADLIMPGSNLSMRRVRYDGETLSWSTTIPFLSEEPARADVKVTGNKFEGAMTTALGEVTLVGERVDTTKLVVAPYDDPKAVLGSWDVTANVNGEESQAKLLLEVDGERLKGVINTPDAQFESQQVEYEKVGESMGVVRMSVVIPDLGTETQVFELVFSGDTFEGEEIHSNGAIFFSGTRTTG